MEADWASVWVAGGAGVIAALALIVSIYAAVVGRGAAKATKKQSEIAAQSYRLAAEPRITLTVSGEHIDSVNKFLLMVTFRRQGGPSILLFNFELEYVYMVSSGRTEKGKFPLMPEWSKWHDGAMEFHSQTVDLAPDQRITNVQGIAEIQMSVSEQAEIWQLQKMMWWPGEYAE